MPDAQCRETLGEIIHCMFATIPEKVGGVVAAVLMAFPWLHQEIKQASDEAALLLPLAGLGFFGLRYWVTILEIRERRHRLENDEAENGDSQ